MASDISTQPEATWWKGTDLDLTFLGTENVVQIAKLAGSPEAFFDKYVRAGHTDTLKNDVQIALDTTEEYAQDFSSRVEGYFNTTWISQQQLPGAENLQHIRHPEEDVTTRIEEVTSRVEETSHPETQTDPKPPIDRPHEESQIPKEAHRGTIEGAQPITQTPSSLTPEERLTLSQKKVKSTLPQSLTASTVEEAMNRTLGKTQNEINLHMSQQIIDLRDWYVAQIVALQSELMEITDDQKKLAKAFDQMRTYLESITNQTKQMIQSIENRPDGYAPPGAMIMGMGQPIMFQPPHPGQPVIGPQPQYVPGGLTFAQQPMMPYQPLPMMRQSPVAPALSGSLAMPPPQRQPQQTHSLQFGPPPSSSSSSPSSSSVPKPSTKIPPTVVPVSNSPTISSPSNPDERSQTSTRAVRSNPTFYPFTSAHGVPTLDTHPIPEKGPAISLIPSSSSPSMQSALISAGRGGDGLTVTGKDALALCVEDLLPLAQFELKDPSVVQCEGRLLTWMKKKETMVMLDHVVIEGVVSAEWRVTELAKDSNLQFGFLMDALDDRSPDDRSPKISCYYRGDGHFTVCSQVYTMEQLKTGDVVRVEIDMNTREAQFFKNEIPCPVRVHSIPPVNRFFVCATGTRTRIELLSLLQLFEHTPVIKKMIKHLVQMNKAC